MSVRSATSLPRPSADARASWTAQVSGAWSRFLATLLLEIRLNLTTPGPWLVGVVLAGFGYVAVRTAPEAASVPLAWILSAEIGPLAVVLLAFVAASFAHRPARYEMNELLESKRVASEELILGRWLGMVVGIAVPLLLQYGATMLAQEGEHKSPLVAAAYAASFARLFPSALLLGTLAFALVTLTRVLILGGGLAGLAWFVLYFGQSFYPSSFRPDLSQNATVTLGQTATLLLIVLTAFRGQRRAKRAPSAYVFGISAGLLGIATLLTAIVNGQTMPSGRTATATWERLRDGRIRRQDPLPNLAWVDTRGERVSLAGSRGRPLLLVLVQPKDTGLLALLRRLDAVQKEFGTDKLGVLPLVLSEDLGTAKLLADLSGTALGLVSEWGRPGGRTFKPDEPGSSTAWVFGIDGTPRAVLIRPDGTRSGREIRLEPEAADDLRQQVRRAIAGETEEDEPEPPANPGASLPPGITPPGATPPGGMPAGNAPAPGSGG